MFWVVYDREAAIKYPDALHAEACRKADAQGIKIAFSNICFEVWILLHFQATMAAYTNFDDLKKRSKLRTHIKNYDKGIKRLFSAEEIYAARKRAEALNQRTIAGADPAWVKPYQWNPYTDVYKLLDAIDDFGAKHCVS